MNPESGPNNSIKSREHKKEIPLSWFSGIGDRHLGVVQVSFSQEFIKFIESKGIKFEEFIEEYKRVIRYYNKKDKKSGENGRNEKNGENKKDEKNHSPLTAEEKLKLEELRKPRPKELKPEEQEELEKLEEREELEEVGKLEKEIEEKIGLSFKELDWKRRKLEISYEKWIKEGIEPEKKIKKFTFFPDERYSKQDSWRSHKDVKS